MKNQITSKATKIIKHTLIATVIVLSTLPSATCGNTGSVMSKYLFPTIEPDMLLKGHSSPICAATFSPEDSLIATGSTEGKIIIWNQDGTIKDSRKVHKGAIQSLRFSEDGSFLVSTAQGDNFVNLWYVNTPDYRRQRIDMQEPIQSAFLSPDNTKMVVITPPFHDIPPFCKVMDIITKHCLVKKEDIIAAQFRPGNNEKLLMVSDNGLFTNFNMKTKSSIMSRSRNDKIYMEDRQPTGICLSPDAKIVAITYATGGNSEEVRIGNYSSDEAYPSIIRDKDSEVIITNLKFSPDSTKIIYVTGSKTVHIWDIESGSIDAKIECEYDHEFCPILNSDNTHILMDSQEYDNTAVMFSVPETQK